MSMDTATIDIRQPVKNRRIGELLVSKGVVSEDQVRIALTEQRRTKEHLGRILVRQAQQHPERRVYAERYLKRMLPRVTALGMEIQGSVDLEDLATTSEELSAV